jgi:hypothetical protein
MVISVRRILIFSVFVFVLAAQVLPVVPVCLQGEPGIDTSVIHYGRPIASAILEQVGVRLHWTCADDAIQVQFVPRTPRDIGKHTLAVAFPHAAGGVRILIFDERITPFFARDSQVSGRFLGHVLAHEIGHILSGTNAHSEEGLMRAHWTPKDVTYMRVRLFKFNRNLDSSSGRT